MSRLKTANYEYALLSISKLGSFPDICYTTLKLKELMRFFFDFELRN
jgi:hypothetical protein